VPADDFRGPHDARGTGAWACRESNATEGIGEGANLLVPRSVCEL
jgi:hypothetical protein